METSNNIELSLPRQLHLEYFRRAIQQANREQAVELAIKFYSLYLQQQQAVADMKIMK